MYGILWQRADLTDNNSSTTFANFEARKKKPEFKLFFY
jgi:hypothetical protein